MSEVSKFPPIDVDITTRARVGSLVAYGLSDQEICDALLLSPNQLDFCRATSEYREAYGTQLLQRAEQRGDIERGWDAVEERGIEVALKHLMHSNDPKFALMAAVAASRAPRKPASSSNKIIDANGGAKVIVLSLSKTYIQRARNGDDAMVIQQRDNSGVAQIPKKQVDIPAPTKVIELLGGGNVSRKLPAGADETAGIMQKAGITFENLDLDFGRDE